MGYAPPSDECAPCELGFTNDKEEETKQPDHEPGMDQESTGRARGA